MSDDYQNRNDYRNLDDDGAYRSRHTQRDAGRQRQTSNVGSAQRRQSVSNAQRQTSNIGSTQRRQVSSNAQRQASNVGNAQRRQGGSNLSDNPSGYKSAVGRYTNDSVSRQTPDKSRNDFKVAISEEDYFDSESVKREISAAERNIANASRRSERRLVTTAPREPATTTTRVVTSSVGDKYQIQEEEVIAPRQIKKRQNLMRQRNRGCIVALIYSAVVCSISVLLSYYLVLGLNDMLGLSKDDLDIVVEVSKDATLDDITELLDENGVIDFPMFFKLYAKFSNKDDGFKAGSFTLNSNLDYRQILTKLRLPAAADKSTITVTIPEGLTVVQVAEIMEENSVCTAEAFLSSVNEKDFSSSYSFLENVDTENENRIYKLEGFLFPDTYNFYLNDGSVNAISTLLSEFSRKWTDEYQAQADKIGMSMDDVVTLASIVEREASDSEDRKMVASVFYNRLNSSVTGGKLQSDATRWYPYATYEDLMASEDLTDEEKTDWVENHKGVCDTYAVTGLPDSPICNPSISSIEAVLYHSDTNYYFFCSDDDGNFYYASTLDEHNANLEKIGLA